MLRTRNAHRRRSRGDGKLVKLPRRTRWSRVRRPVLMAASVVLAAVVAGVVLLRVGEIRVRVSGGLMPERIQAESGLAGGERILLTRMAKIEARLEGIPEVRSVIVERRLPTTVVIHAVGREPLAVLDIDPAMAVDAQGLMFVARTARPLAALAGWEGQVAPGRSVDPRTRQVLAAYAGFPLGLRDAVVRIDVGAELVLHVGDGTRIEFGPPRDLERKGAAAASVLAAARGRGELLEYVDVRAATAPVSRERGLPTPSPAPAAGD